jgi:hypothetical protein
LGCFALKKQDKNNAVDQRKQTRGEDGGRWIPV